MSAERIPVTNAVKRRAVLSAVLPLLLLVGFIFLVGYSIRPDFVRCLAGSSWFAGMSLLGPATFFGIGLIQHPLAMIAAALAWGFFLVSLYSTRLASIPPALIFMASALWLLVGAFGTVYAARAIT